MEFKQNRFLPAEKQMVTANPDIHTVSLFLTNQLTSCVIHKIEQRYHSFMVATWNNQK